MERSPFPFYKVMSNFLHPAPFLKDACFRACYKFFSDSCLTTVDYVVKRSHWENPLIEWVIVYDIKQDKIIYERNSFRLLTAMASGMYNIYDDNLC